MSMTAKQLFWILFSLEIGNTLLVTISPTAALTRQNLWLSYIAAGILCMLITWIAARVALLHPHRDFLDICRAILGNWLGTLVVLAYMIQWFSAIGIILYDFTEFASTVLLPATPTMTFAASLMLLVLYALHAGGIRSVGRCSEFFGPIIVFSLLLILLLFIPDAEPHRLLPVYADTGLKGVAAGAVFPYALLGETVMLMALAGFLHQPGRLAVSALGSVGLTSALIVVSVVFVVMTLGGELAASLKNPLLVTISYINAMNFLQNLEIVGVLVWILSLFVKLSVYLFLLSYHAARIFGVKKWTKLAWPAALASIGLLIAFQKFAIDGNVFMRSVWLPYIVPAHMALLPLLLLAVGAVRKKMRRRD